MLTLREKAIAFAAVILLALACFAGYELLQEHDAKLRAQSESDVQKQIAKSAQDAIAAATASKSQNDADLKTALAAIAAQRTVVVTPLQAAQVANTLPGLPTPVQVQAVPATAAAPATEEIVIPQADIPAFQKYKLDCDAHAATLNACQLNAAEDKIIAAQKDVQLEAITKDRDSWKTTAKGGTFWHRSLTAAKWIVVAGAVGYVAGKKF